MNSANTMARDSEMVVRFKNSGLVILGKTNVPALGILGITEPELHGPTLNPRTTGHTPGGSSGGFSRGRSQRKGHPGRRK